MALVAVTAVPALAGCIAAPEGELAVARTADGDLLVFVAPCNGVYHTVDMVRSEQVDVKIGAWHRKRVLLPGASVNVTHPSRSKGWTTLVPWDGELVLGEVYRLSASGTYDAKPSYGLTIDSQTVDYLGPGELLTRSDDGVQVRQESVDDWADRACDDGWF